MHQEKLFYKLNRSYTYINKFHKILSSKNVSSIFKSLPTTVEDEGNKKQQLKISLHSKPQLKILNA